jgi:hypothetical protein
MKYYYHPYDYEDGRGLVQIDKDLFDRFRENPAWSWDGKTDIVNPDKPFQVVEMVTLDIYDADDGLVDGDEIGEVINSDLLIAAETCAYYLANHYEHIRPFEAAKVAALTFAASALSDSDGGEYMRKEFGRVFDYYKGVDKFGDKHGQGFTSNFVEGLPDVVKADILLQMPIVDCVGHSDPGAAVERHFALDVAKHLGPEWAQAWYHFTVFMTKVA